MARTPDPTHKLSDAEKSLSRRTSRCRRRAEFRGQ